MEGRQPTMSPSQHKSISIQDLSSCQFDAIDCLGRVLPFCSCSRHSKVISKWYESVNLAGLLRILTPSNETTDIMEGDDLVMRSNRKRIRAQEPWETVRFISQCLSLYDGFRTVGREQCMLIIEWSFEVAIALFGARVKWFHIRISATGFRQAF